MNANTLNLSNLLSSANLAKAKPSTLPLASIIVKPQIRTVFPEAAQQEMTESVRLRGVHTPVAVHESSPGVYELVAGERRYRAALANNLAEIPVYYITQMPSDEERPAFLKLLQLSENIDRVDLTPHEVAQTIKELLEIYKTQKEVAARIGRSPQWVNERLALLDLPTHTEEARQAGVSDASTLNALKTAERRDPEGTKQLVQQIKAQPGKVAVREEARKLASQAKDAKGGKGKDDKQARNAPGISERSGSPNPERTAEPAFATQRDRSAEAPGPVLGQLFGKPPGSEPAAAGVGEIRALMEQARKNRGEAVKLLESLSSEAKQSITRTLERATKAGNDAKALHDGNFVMAFTGAVMAGQLDHAEPGFPFALVAFVAGHASEPGDPKVLTIPDALDALLKASAAT